MATKDRIALTERVAMPGASSARCRASKNVTPSRRASASTQAIARSPMPRLGSLTIRRRLISSAVLASIRR